ncbi:hypothetical protein EB796_000518 [Bugula neritina]|uniref:Cadherin domain-containing protein n=1 Tax=Bugula neritina TaxID=10212 RepID=A0A7J7KSK4_BUGNE|nr:hypothetical protein EB796_000518 [Bugula neritina]
MDCRNNGDPDNLFTVRLNGEVHLNHALDYEQLVSKTKRIIVDAMTSTGQVSSATLEISVTNVNDNPPVFSEQMYTFSVTEGTFVTNQRVGSVFATDRDEGTELVYQLVGRYNNLFYINNQGSIFVKENVVIDAEVTRKYEVQVEVSDSSSQTGYKASVPVVIHVDTANEFYPVCAEDVFTFFVPKAIVVGRGFGQVVATDEDVGDSVQYFISNGAAEFAVDQQTGVISAAQSLTQREQSKYSLTVVARDSTAPYREVVCPVNILVISSQQSNLPIFVQPPNEGYTYTIPEGSDFDSTVLQVEVRSADNKILEGITYSLANTTDIFYFDIDERTGRIYVVNDLDRELKDTYQLIVVARTNTTELSRYFQIILSDVDDNDPKFSNCDLMYPVRLEVEEGESGSQEVIGAVRACDEDEGVNGKIYYHVVECEDGTTTKQSGRFSINIETGEISVDPGTLDYETSTTHTICVNASTSRINANVRSDQWKVVIVVKNKDDFKLEFTRTQISVVVGGNVGSGQEIVQIKANGQDVASLNSVTYEILSITYFKGLEIVEGSNNVTIESAFVINRFTGKVTTTLPSYLKMIGARFEIKIRAKTSSDSADLTLTVMIDQSPDEVQTFIEEFFRELEEIHEGYTFHLQRLSFHEDPYTQQSYQNKTDVYMYVLDKDGNLVDASTVSSILYSTYSETQAELYRKYGVTFSGPTAESLVSATRVWLDWYNYEWIWWLIIASSIVLFIDAVVLIICLLYLYNKYVKKPSRYVPNIVKLK